jgi:very-short-patch-repair endonuclease
MEGVDRVIGQAAERQHGLLTLSQLRDLGVTRAQMRSRLRQGVLAKEHNSVVRIAGAPVTPRVRLLAAVLGAGPTAVASHRSAAVLWGLEGIWENEPEMTVPRGCRFRPATGVLVHQSTDLDRSTPTVIDGVPATSVERTLLDLGAVVPARKVHIALDHARRRKITSWNALLDTLVTHARRGRDGVGTLRSILDDHFGEVVATESGFERLVYSFLREAGLPAPILQYEVRIGPQRFRLDMAYPEKRVAIELDGAVHLRQDVWEADHVRQNALVNGGWTILRYTWKDYTEHQGRIFTEIKAALSRN